MEYDQEDIEVIEPSDSGEDEGESKYSSFFPPITNDDVWDTSLL